MKSLFTMVIHNWALNTLRQSLIPGQGDQDITDHNLMAWLVTALSNMGALMPALQLLQATISMHRIPP